MLKLPTRRNNNRIPQHDYSKPGHYFITICTQERRDIFGIVKNNQMILNDAGSMIDSVIKEIPDYYQGIFIDQYIIMPNHIHAIINIVGVDPRVDPFKNLCASVINNNISCNNHRLNNNGRTQGSAPTTLSLSNIIQRFKTLTTKKYIDGVKNNHWPAFAKRLWQRNYYDHIIRNDKSLDKIRQYIINNPVTWQFDLENPDRIGNMKKEEIIV